MQNLCVHVQRFNACSIHIILRAADLVWSKFGARNLTGRTVSGFGSRMIFFYVYKIIRFEETRQAFFFQSRLKALY